MPIFVCAFFVCRRRFLREMCSTFSVAHYAYLCSWLEKKLVNARGIWSDSSTKALTRKEISVCDMLQETVPKVYKQNSTKRSKICPSVAIFVKNEFKSDSLLYSRSQNSIWPQDFLFQNNTKKIVASSEISQVDYHLIFWSHYKHFFYSLNDYKVHDFRSKFENGGWGFDPFSNKPI